MQTTQEINAELRTLFPTDTPKVRMAFTMALAKEQVGDSEAAERYLTKAIEAENEPTFV